MGVRGRWRRWLATCALGAACVPALAGDAAAAVGDLAQKAGLGGCVSESGAGGCVDGTALDGAVAVTVSPDGKSAYTASRDGDAVVVFDRAANGALTQKAGTAGCISETGAGGCADGRALDNVYSVTVSPDGTSVYAASEVSAAVAVFDRAANGALTQKAGTAGCISNDGSAGCVDGTALSAQLFVTVSPDGANVYAASFDSDAVAVFDRAASGALTQKAGTAGCISNTGSGGTCVDGRGLNAPRSVAVSADGTSAYVASTNGDAIAVFDRAGATGALTQKALAAGCVSDTGADGCADGTALDAPRLVTVSPDGNNVYATSQLSDAVVLFDRAADGGLTQKAGTAGCISETGADGCADGRALDGAFGVTVSPDGKSVYAASNLSDAIAVFDRADATGALTQKAAAAGCISETGADGCADGTALDNILSATVSPDNRSVYAASSISDAVAVFDRVRVAAGSLPAVARMSTGWWLRDSLSTGPETATFSFGVRPTTPLMGDWNADGTRTPGSYEGGVFKLRNTNAAGPPDHTIPFGDARGFPLAGDFDGDGFDDVAVYRAGTWQTRLSTGATASFSYGAGNWPATIPVTGDWNGDGIDGIGTYTYNTAIWALRNAAGPGTADAGSVVFGTPSSSYPVPGDWNGDALDSVGVKTGGTWTVRNTNTAGLADLTFSYGLAGDLPLTWRSGAP